MTGSRTRPRGPAERLAPLLIVALTLAAAVTGIGPAVASAATCGAWSGPQPPSPGTGDNNLNGVATA